MLIGLIHTTMNSIAPINDAFRAIDPDVRLMNFLDEGIMPELRSKGATARTKREILQLAWAAEAAGADGILMNCSLMSPYAGELAKCVDIPLIGADFAMLEYVTGHARRVGVVSTVAKAGPTTKRLLEELAASRGKTMDVSVTVVPEAFAALNQGDVQKHNELVQRAALAYDGKVDMIVFSQMSMVRALTPDFAHGHRTEIVTSPSISAKSILAKVRAVKKEG